jgi:outer membrane murein-binding lipoprotein Lpp
MRTPLRRLVLRRLATSLLVVLGLAAAAGCSDTAPPSSASAAVPEEERASAADVATGLAKIDTLARDIAAAGTATRAQQLIDQIEPTWMRIEGTVKANDRDAYLALEDSFAQLAKAASGDAATAVKGATTVAVTVAAYLAKYPG